MKYKKVYCLDCKIKISSNAKRCRSCSKSGRHNTFYGKKHSLKTIKKLSRLAKARLKNPKNNPWFGKKHSLKARKKISLNHANIKGENNPLFGKHHSKETKKKISKSNTGKKTSLKTRKIRSKNRIKWMLTHSGKFIDTDIEIIVKNALNKLKIKYEHPFKVGNHLADFYLPKHNLVIECDGEYWHNMPGRKIRDRKQTKMMRNFGYKVKRFTGKQIKNENFINFLRNGAK